MQLSHFDLNLLRTLDAVLSERSVIRAANQLCLSQQGVSGALQRLREHFSDHLLVRVEQRMELTPLGLALVDPVRAALVHVQDALDTQPSFMPARSKMVVRLASSDYTMFVILAGLARRFADEAPAVTCRVEALDETSFHALEQGHVDFCLAPSDWRLFDGYEPSCEIRMLGLFSDDYVCVVDRDHPVVGSELTMGDYETLTHSCAAFRRGVITSIERKWREAGLALRVAMTVPSFSAVLRMLPGTTYVATVQRRLAESLEAPLGLRVLECPFPLKPLNWHLVWHARNDRSPGHEYVRSTVIGAVSLIPDARSAARDGG